MHSWPFIHGTDNFFQDDTLPQSFRGPTSRAYGRRGVLLKQRSAVHYQQLTARLSPLSLSVCEVKKISLFIVQYFTWFTIFDLKADCS